jgi:TfoX/Sxy family transcriptional regulator of competence genes
MRVKIKNNKIFIKLTKEDSEQLAANESTKIRLRKSGNLIIINWIKEDKNGRD